MLDLQINGYAGVDFNNEQLTLDQMERACARLTADGVSGILPTIITDDLPLMCRRLARIAELHARSESVARIVKGIHIEGPFFPSTPGCIGAHPPEHARTATITDAAALIDAAGGLTRLFTLAPEQDPDGTVTAWLTERQIVVAAGHCDASLEQLGRSIEAGLKAFTHLGNGCPGKLQRHDNIVQRALYYADRLTLCFIADGAHIPLFALKNYLACAGIQNCLIVSDAISAAGQGPGTYQVADQRVNVGSDLVPWSLDRSHFVGSACTLLKMRQNLLDAGLSPTDLQQLFAANPRKLLNL